MKTPQFITLIKRFAVHYKGHIALNILCNVLATLFSIFSFAVLIPILQILFKTEQTIYEFQPWSLDSIKNNGYYYVQQYIENHGGIDTLLLLAVVLIIMTFLKTGTTYLASYFIIPMRTGLVRDIRRDMYAKIVDLNLGFYDKQKRGDIMARMLGDVNEVEASIMSSIELLSKNPIMIIFYLGVMLMLSWELTLFVLLVLPVAGFLMGRVGRSLKRKSVVGQEQQGSLTSIIEETLNGLRIIKAFNAEEHINKRFGEMNNELRKTTNKINRRYMLAHPMSEFLGTMMIAIVLFFGGSLILNEQSSLNAGEFIYYLVIFYSIINPAKDLSKAMYSIEKGKASLARIDMVLMANNPLKVVDNPVEAKPFDKGISFNDVWFKYDEDWILKGVSLDIKKGQTVALVGASGSGKSTLLNILMGIEKPDKGKVFFNKKDIFKMRDKSFSKYHLEGVSMVYQHFNLFENQTALENCLTPLEMKGISRKNAIHEIEEQFKKFGIENLLKRKVKNMSGGEKQRIAIIRSIVTKPLVLLCDEPTGALDKNNSNEIMKILKKLSERILVVLVSHNNQLVNQYSDEIITLKDGEIVNKLSNIKKHFSNNYKKEKIKYNSRWMNRFLKCNFKKDFVKNLFSIVACTFSFISIMLSIGFLVGSKASQENAINQNLSMNFSTVSKTEFLEIEGSPLSYQKTVRPEFDQIDSAFEDFSSLEVKENLSYFISNYSSVYFDEKQITNYEMIPLNDASLETFGKELLIDGNPLNENFEEIIINTEFAGLLDVENPLNLELIISSSAPVSYSTNNKNQPFIKDVFSYTKRFRIVGIVKEFPFLNNPKIFYSYEGAKKFLKSQKMENLSIYKNTPISYYNYLENSKPDEDASSYSYYLFINDESELNNFYKKIKELETSEDEIQVTSAAYNIKETYQLFIDSFSSTLIVFVIIAFLGVNFILGMISLSTFIQNKKDTAILTCLGAQNTSIYNLYLLENYCVVTVAFILAISLINLLQKKINVIIEMKFGLANLIDMPFKTFLGIPFGLFIILFFLFCIFVTLFTIVPMIIYRKGAIANELRDE